MFKRIFTILVATALTLPLLAQQPTAPAGKKAKKVLRSVFLIRHGLPHYTALIKQHWDDPELALNETQKKRLLAIRKKTLGAIKRLAPQAAKLHRKIVQQGRKGTKAAKLAPLVNKLAALKAEATMVHLECIEQTLAVLDEKQRQYLQSLYRDRSKKRHKKGH